MKRGDGKMTLHLTATLIFQAVFTELLSLSPSTDRLFSSERLSRLAAFSDLAYIPLKS